MAPTLICVHFFKGDISNKFYVLCKICFAQTELASVHNRGWLLLLCTETFFLINFSVNWFCFPTVNCQLYKAILVRCQYILFCFILIQSNMTWIQHKHVLIISGSKYVEQLLRGGLERGWDGSISIFCLASAARRKVRVREIALGCSPASHLHLLLHKALT